MLTCSAITRIYRTLERAGITSFFGRPHIRLLSSVCAPMWLINQRASFLFCKQTEGGTPSPHKDAPSQPMCASYPTEGDLLFSHDYPANEGRWVTWFSRNYRPISPRVDPHYSTFQVRVSPFCKLLDITSLV